MWSEFFKRWLDQIFWWLPPRDSDHREEPGESHEEGGQRSTAESPTPREPTTSPRPEQAPTHSAESARPQPRDDARASTPEAAAAPAAEDRSDDLTALKGIGPAMQTRLNGIGIRSFSDLARADADELTARIKESRAVISATQVQDWIAAARERG